MKRLMRSNIPGEVTMVRDLLERAGIDCITRGEQLGGALGDIPFLECEPEVWVLRDEDMAAAQRVLARHRAPSGSAARWRCSNCSEWVEGQFEACWRCGTLDTADNQG